MSHRRKILTAIIGTLVITSAVYADMTPVSRLNTVRQRASQVFGRTALQYTKGLFSCFNVTGLDIWSVTLLPEAKADVSQASEMQQPQILTDGTGSFSLCLCALIGLGLCRTAPWVRKLSFGFVPEWYHNGGPFQIGHSFAISPESLCPVPAYCFIQPVCMAEDSVPQYRLGTITSLWRKSQFSPTVLAARGPPDIS